MADCEADQLREEIARLAQQVQLILFLLDPLQFCQFVRLSVCPSSLLILFLIPIGILHHNF